jgi:hypothetical protein
MRKIGVCMSSSYKFYTGWFSVQGSLFYMILKNINTIFYVRVDRV